MSDQSVINNPQAEQNPPVDFARPWIRHYEQSAAIQAIPLSSTMGQS